MSGAGGDDDANLPLRRAIYAVLIVTAVGTMVGRIASVAAEHGKTPFLSANDRSRWAAVRALVDHGTFAIDEVIFDQRRQRPDKRWDTIDKVRHLGRDGQLHYYSSKPPLLVVLLAAEYWLLQQVTGTTLEAHPFYVGRIVLVLTNVLPLAVVWVGFARLVDRLGTTDWGRTFTMAAAVWGTFLTTMAVTLNNHSVAAVCAFACVCLFVPIWTGEARQAWRFFALGLLAAFAAANELPALSLTGMLGLLTLWKAPKEALLISTPAVLLVAAAFFGTNYWAHGSWKMPYAHRGDGELIASPPRSEIGPLRPGEAPAPLRAALAEVGWEIGSEAELEPRAGGDGWKLRDAPVARRLAIRQAGDVYEIRRWDDWYDYPGSYWMTDRSGVDRGEASRWVYAFHMLAGHNGWFSLTPLWVLAAGGILLALRRPASPLWPLALATVAVFLACAIFYVSRGQIDRNYGGVATGFRWLFWMIPLWLVCLLPAADRLATSRFGRALALAALAVSVFSATYGAANPWSHPWLFDYWTTMQWIDYSAR